MGEGIKRTSMVARASSLQSLKDSAAGWILLALSGAFGENEELRISSIAIG